MSDDLFGDIEAPDEGFDTSRPERPRPTREPQRADPHREGGFGDGGFFDTHREETPIDEFFEDRSTPEGHNLEAEDAAEVQQAESPNDYALNYGGDFQDHSRDSFLTKTSPEDPDGALLPATSVEAPEDYDPEALDVESLGEQARERSKLVRLATVGAAVLVGGSVLVGATMWGVNAFSGSDDATASSEHNADWATPIPEFTEGGEFTAQFSEAEVFSVSTTGPTSWFAAGIAEFTDDDEVILYSNIDGEQLASADVGDYEYIVEFRHQGDDVIGVRTEDGLTAIRDDGEVETFEFDGSVVVNGTTPIVYSEESTQVLDFDEGLIDFEVNNNLNTVAADEGIVHQVDPEEPVMVTIDPEDTVAAEELEMTPPEEEARFVRWAGAGHGYAGAIWSTDEGMWLGVHDVESGDAETLLPATDATGYWQVGRGMTAATLDDYAISMITGEVLAADEQMDGAYSHYAYTEDRRIFDHDDEDPTVYTEDTRIIGASGTTVFVRTPSGDVAAYDRQGATS